MKIGEHHYFMLLKGEINLLLSQGSDINKSDNDGKTPLLYSIGKVDKDTICILLSRGSNINESDKSGKTPL